jgi:hypothetical protein
MIAPSYFMGTVSGRPDKSLHLQKARAILGRVKKTGDDYDIYQIPASG